MYNTGTVHLIVTGGRDYTNKQKVFNILDQFQLAEVSVGDCPTGVDLFVREYVQLLGNSVCLNVYKALWDEHGRAAGPIRNQKMIKENANSIVLAFPGGKGTFNCVREALKRGMIVLKVEEK